MVGIMPNQRTRYPDLATCISLACRGFHSSQVELGFFSSPTVSLGRFRNSWDAATPPTAIGEAEVIPYRPSGQDLAFNHYSRESNLIWPSGEFPWFQLTSLVELLV